MYFIDDKKRYVRDIQKYINIISRMKKTIPRVSIDGIYGRETKNSIFIFQQNNNINPTGVLYKATFDVLFREYAALLELELARVIDDAFYAHGTIVITIDFTRDNIVYGHGNFAPLKSISILKLQS